MSTEDFVTYEQAVKLKELEFCGEAMGKYIDCPKDPTLFHGMIYQSWNLEKTEILAPTLAQAAKWLREVKKMTIVCSPETDSYDDQLNEFLTGQWYYELWLSNEEYWFPTTKTYSSYEEALSAGIDKVLEVLCVQ